MTKHVGLLVNHEPIDLDYFVQGLIDHTVSGMMEALEGTGEIRDLNIVIEEGQTAVKLNGSPVQVNPFVSRIFKNTIAGMVSTLKGVNEINHLDISIEK